MTTDQSNPGHPQTPTSQPVGGQSPGRQETTQPLLTNARQRLANIQNIDLYLAAQLCDWLNCPEDWLFHTIAGASHTLQQGHSCLYLPAWAGKTEWQTDDKPGYTFSALEDWLAKLSALPIGPDDNAPIVLEDDRLYLRRYWHFERELAGYLRQRMHPNTEAAALDTKAAKAALHTLFPTLAEPGDPTADTQTDWQAIAAANALFNGFNIIAGGPGTGKTYTVTRLLALLAMTSPHDLNILMAAPTGKAAQRLAESIRDAKRDLAGRIDLLALNSIPDDAKTLHRLLGVIPNQLDFRHNERNPLDCDVLLVDEVSMVDLPMMTRLFRALPEHTKVIFLGDADQLPSVAAGSVLADLAQRPHPGYSQQRTKALKTLGLTVPTQSAQPEPKNSQLAAPDYLTFLKHSRRFGQHSGIGRLANQVINGEAEASLATLKSDAEDLAWIPADKAQQQISQWVDHWYRPIANAADKTAAFEALFQFRLLCPARVGPLGVEALNERILKTLNPTRAPFFKGQPIMITENHYGVGLYNGDIGLIWPDDTTGHLMAWFQTGDNDYRPLAPGRLPRFETVYAMTIHKTQGSEFERVAIVLPEQAMGLLSRELVYTGLTRAKRELFVVGGEGVWCEGVLKQIDRNSGLALRLNP
ncbi:exodeoxyribonuclease V subunit alpha [Saccharospirillum impatiens]|uniref:exodeoxyribonuclease V subunit alpha n=1 Tax=Saccharospirillum impatiens TaxID=169438 RepID=UPI000425DB73|nr:exodeoxyribonuclease V subunit alpha [Saccharospirillum impatiens]